MTEPVAPHPPLPTGRFEGRETFTGLVRQALTAAASEGWSRIVLSDPDFADWPLGERAVVEALQAWSARGRHIQFMARDFGLLRQQHPRLVQWRTTWSHIVEAHACPGAAGSDIPSALWTPGWTLERLDLVRCTGVTSLDAQRRMDLLERLEASWHKGHPSFPATTLGL